MTTLITRALAGWRNGERHRRDAMRLSRLPDYLLVDMGITPDSEASLARQLDMGRKQ